VPEIEDPVTTLVRLLKANMRVVNDDGSIANIHISREWYDRELLKNYDGQVTAGLRQPSQVKPLNLSQSLSHRILNLKVDCWVVDKPGRHQQRGHGLNFVKKSSASCARNELAQMKQPTTTMDSA